MSESKGEKQVEKDLKAIYGGVIVVNVTVLAFMRILVIKNFFNFLNSYIEMGPGKPVNTMSLVLNVGINFHRIQILP